MVDNPFEHIFYEVDLYHFSIQLLNSMSLTKEDLSPEEQRIYNMVVDNHALHLRNLAKFFSVRYKSESDDQYWRAADYLNDTVKPIVLDEAFGKEIQQYTSHSTCHLLGDRLKVTNKADASKCYIKAIPEIESAIQRFIVALDTDVKAKYKNKWADIRPFIVPRGDGSQENTAEVEPE